MTTATVRRAYKRFVSRYVAPTARLLGDLMESRDLWLGFLGVLLTILLVVGVPYGSYKLGRYLERREYTKVFIKATKLTYDEAFVHGYKQGTNDATEQCDEDCLEIGRY